MNVTFRAFPQFNRQAADELVSSTSKLSRGTAEIAFGSDRLPDVCVRELAAEHALPTKEIVESFELFERIREQVRASTLADLCAGHGLLGTLFAAFERRVERVYLLDRETPPNRARVIEAMRRAAPWVEEKIFTIECDAGGWESSIDACGAASVVSSHACGELTDRCIRLAIDRRLPIAVMPCCYPWRACPGPPAVKRALGVELAMDIDRSYRLEQAGYSVLWREIPKTITPKNRILIGKP